MHSSDLTNESLRHRILELGPWFHNMELRGIQTAPHHPLGDYPTVKWRSFAPVVAALVHDKSVLDIGCNAGFYAIEMSRLGAARVVAIDEREDYLEQARFAAEILGYSIEFHRMSVYDIAALQERFDVVLFMGVLYHLRHPLLALDLIHEHVAKDHLVFQSMLRGSSEVSRVEENYTFWQDEHFDLAGYPKLHFVERRYADDGTNWWIPNRACAEAMLRSAGFQIEQNPEAEVFICRADAARSGAR